MNIKKTAAWKKLRKHADRVIAETHLRDMMSDATRCKKLRRKSEGIVLDSSRQRANSKTLDLLLELADEVKLSRKIRRMRNGVKINETEKRAVLHYVLRWPENQDPGKDTRKAVRKAIGRVHNVLRHIEKFCREVRSGRLRGATGKELTDIVVIGIGGSYLGTEFVFEALRTDPECALAAQGRRLRFLANIDPIAVARTLDGLNPERTLVIVISKTFTTAETMLNAKTLRHWLQQSMPGADIGLHFAAVTAETALAVGFCVPENRVFTMWGYIGGRYSVTSAVGVLPLSLQYGFANVRQFLDGAHAMDMHFFGADLKDNLPVLLGLFGVWNSSFLGYGVRALLPYCEALLKFAAHIQQLDMESNGKRVTLTGEDLGFDAGEINFGEPGTNGQHSFYQLMHQGRGIPADFIGFKRSQQPREVPGESVANHDELMANYFAQPDALAIGKTIEEALAECEANGDSPELAPHKTFPGNRPSTMLLFDELTPYTAGQLLALYEHRTAVQGFVWGISSWDQWGVELGKSMATALRAKIAEARKGGALDVTGLNPSAAALLTEYLGP